MGNEKGVMPPYDVTMPQVSPAPPHNFAAEWKAMYLGPGMPKLNAPWPTTNRGKLVRMKARRKWWLFGPWIVTATYEAHRGEA